MISRPSLSTIYYSVSGPKSSYRTRIQNGYRKDTGRVQDPGSIYNRESVGKANDYSEKQKLAVPSSRWAMKFFIQHQISATSKWRINLRAIWKNQLYQKERVISALL
jgi:hypothetical protein